ncbi:MAG: nucleotidyltransferase domain-containing protein [Candidatus Bathyarchaeia archaeon]
MEGLTEGYFLGTVEGLIFEVRGHVHPPGFTVAYLRYAPYEALGRGVSRGGFVKVYDLEERWRFLREKYPEYLRFDEAYGRIMQEVPDSRVRRIFDPKAKLMGLRRGARDRLESKALEMAEELSGVAGVDLGSMGVSGSILLGLHGRGSDLDLIVYGRDESLRVNGALRDLLSKGGDFKPHGERGLLRLYRVRGLDKLISFGEFQYAEKGKTFQGLFKGSEYFIRFVEHPHEAGGSYGNPSYRPLGRGSFEAVVLDDSRAIFTPCSYMVEGWAQVGAERIPIGEVASFRGRFCSQAGKGDHVRGMGTVEKALWRDKPSRYRVIVGEDRGDFLIPRMVG